MPEQPALTPVTMALYTATHHDRDLACAAAEFLAVAWVTTIAIIQLDDLPGFRLFDLGADLDGDIAARALAIYNPDGYGQRRAEQRRHWTETDWRDAATYGWCRCGEPFRARIDRDDANRPTRSYATCDAGHEMGAGW